MMQPPCGLRRFAQPKLFSQQRPEFFDLRIVTERFFFEVLYFVTKNSLQGLQIALERRRRSSQ